MSAYICMPEHFGILAAYAAQSNCVLHEWQEGGATSIQSAQRVARELARENIRSVTYRYPNDEDGSRPGPGLKDAEIEEAAAIYAAHFMAHPQGMAPIEVIKLCNSYEYQSCETEDWKDTLAYRQINWIQSLAVRCLRGYDAAKWEYTCEVQLPEVEALYEKEK